MMQTQYSEGVNEPILPQINYFLERSNFLQPPQNIYCEFARIFSMSLKSCFIVAGI